MGSPTFDLVDAVRDLLRRIEQGRRAIKAASPVSRDFGIAAQRRDEAWRKWMQLHSQPLPEEESARRMAEAEVTRLQDEYEGLEKEANRLWLEFKPMEDFIGPFAEDIATLTDRLPRGPEWNFYARAIRKLDVNRPDAWTDPPPNPDLVTLELRLNEMLALATKAPRKSPSQLLTEFKVANKIGTHEKVAERLGLERSVYFDLKAGKKSSEETRIKAARVIGCSPDDLKP
jgi:hypothetical protein